MQTTFAQETYLPIWIDAFLIDHQTANLAAGTERLYREKLAKFQAFRESQAITQIDQLTPQNIREYLIFLKSPDILPSISNVFGFASGAN